MAGFIFGIIILIAGIIACAVLASIKKEVKSDKYEVDESGNRVRDGWGDYKHKKVITTPYKKFSALACVGGLILGILFTSFGCITSVSTGNTGVVTTFGRVEDYTLEAGFHIKAPESLLSSR